jgi:hypothetical protein
MRQSRLFHKKYKLHKRTYIIVLLLLAFIFLVCIIGRKAKLQQNLTHHYLLQSKAYARELQELKTYIKPTIDYTGKDKAIYIIKKVWRKDWQVGVALTECESGYREKVVNSIGATGYFQINAPVHRVPIEEMQNGWANAGYGYALYKEQGLVPWVSSKECWNDKI